VAEIAKTAMSMHYLDLLPNDDIAEHWEEREYSRKGGLAIDYKEWYVVHLDPIGEVSYAGSILVRMGDDDNFVTAINELRRELVDVTLHSPRLGKEEVADHSNVVRHRGK
jgi:hypothetical protein